MDTPLTLTGRACAAGAALAVLMASAACSSSAGSDPSTTTAAAESSQSTSSATPSGTPATDAPPAGSAGGKKFAYIGSNFATYDTIYCGALAEAQRLGASVSKQLSQDFTAASQIPVLNAALASKPDGVLISPTDPNALYAPIKAAVAGGIPVVTADNTLINTDQLTSQSLVDNRASGTMAAAYLAKQASGRKVKVGVMSFTSGGSAAADAEWHGFEDEIKKYPNIDYIGAQFNQGGAAETTPTAAGMFARNPDLFGMFGTEGDASTGIITAAKQRGLHPLVVAGYAAQTDSLVAALKSGAVAAITDFPFRLVGVNGIDQLVNKLTGRPVDAAPSLSAVLYTKADLDKPGVVLGSAQSKC